MLTWCTCGIKKKKKKLVKKNMYYPREQQKLGISHLKSLAQQIEINKDGRGKDIEIKGGRMSM